MTYEFSAGGVVYKKEEDRLFILVVQHGKYHHWSFPKGHIGDTIPNESKVAAALREVKEETGVTAEILQELSPQTYWYRFEGELRKKTVNYFLMKYKEGSIDQHDFEMEKVEWLEDTQIAERLTFPSDKKTWEEARSFLQTKMQQ